MTRRDLFKLSTSALAAVIFAPFLGPTLGRATGRPAFLVPPSALQALPVKAAPVGPWKMITIVEQEFCDELGRRCEGWVDKIGFGAVFQNQETLEFRRNAVRFEWTRNRSDHRADARKMLRIWGDDLNANWPQEVRRRATQQYWLYDRHDKLVGWHFDDLWKDSDYGGYRVLGYSAIKIKSRS